MKELLYHLIYIASYILATVFSLMATMSLLTWGYQTFTWFRNGEWIIISLGSIFYKDGNLPLLKWKGVEAILHWFIEYPIGWELAIWAGVITIIFIIISVTIEAYLESPKPEKTPI